MEKSWVVVRWADSKINRAEKRGTIDVWRDYGIAWGSPAYEVLGHFNSYESAVMCRTEKKRERTTAEIIKANRLETVKAARVVMHVDTFQNRFV